MEQRPGTRRHSLPLVLVGQLPFLTPPFSAMKHTNAIIHDDYDLMNRALKAYWSSGGTMQPNAADSGVHEHRGQTVVILRTGSEILRVYRVRASGELRRIENPAETRYRWCL